MSVPEQPRLFEPMYDDSARAYLLDLGRQRAAIGSERVRRQNARADAALRARQAELTSRSQAEPLLLTDSVEALEVEASEEMPPVDESIR